MTFDSKAPFVVLVTGLSGAGKTTLAKGVRRAFQQEGTPILILDGDDCRKTLCRDLSFSEADREENLMRLGYMAELAVKSDISVVISSIAPFEQARAKLKSYLDAHCRYYEIFLSASLSCCADRDSKNLYARQRKGRLANFTGFDSPYEKPDAPNLEIDTEHVGIEACITQALGLLCMQDS